MKFLSKTLRLLLSSILFGAAFFLVEFYTHQFFINGTIIEGYFLVFMPIAFFISGLLIRIQAKVTRNQKLTFTANSAMLGAVGLFVFILFITFTTTSPNESPDRAIKMRTASVRANAEISYVNSGETYEQVCNDTEVMALIDPLTLRTETHCLSNQTSYVVTAKSRVQDLFYCVDSQGTWTTTSLETWEEYLNKEKTTELNFECPTQ